MIPILPWVLLASVVCTVLSGVTGYAYGNRIGTQLERADRIADEALAAKAGEAAQLAAAEAIAGIQVKHTTIRTAVEKETRENTVYRDCAHPIGVQQRIAEAFAAVGTGGSELPAAGGAGRRHVRSDDQRPAAPAVAIRPVQNGGAGK